MLNLEWYTLLHFRNIQLYLFSIPFPYASEVKWSEVQLSKPNSVWLCKFSMQDDMMMYTVMFSPHCMQAISTNLS